MHKKFRRGFTLVEMMVVMAIIALLSVLGLSALFSINNNNTTDRAVEETISVIREAQNRAISVANAPDGTTTTEIPLAWGFSVDSTAKKITPFYTKNDTNKTNVSYGASLDYSNMASISVTGGNYHVFTAPFGKYYSSKVAPTLWRENSQRPYDIIPVDITPASPTTIEFNYRNSKRSININANGDVYAN